jgi:hypothetical protein
MRFSEQQKRIVEYFYGGLESDAVLPAIAAALLIVPFVPHRYTYRITIRRSARKGLREEPGVLGANWVHSPVFTKGGAPLVLSAIPLNSVISPL